MLIQLNSQRSINPEEVRAVIVINGQVCILYKQMASGEAMTKVNVNVPKEEHLTVEQVTYLLNQHMHYMRLRRPAFQDKTPQDAPHG